jgi:oligopeptide transport system ATP-binding protein
LQRRRKTIILAGDLPSPIDAPLGCPFVGRCPIRVDLCAQAPPSLALTPGGTEAACFVRAPSEPLS